MVREVLELRSKEFNQNEYKNLLERLIESDSELAFRVIPQLALRSAMRVAPLLGVSGHLGFWRDDRRFIHLAAIFRVFDLSNELTYTAVADAHTASHAAFHSGMLAAYYAATVRADAASDRINSAATVSATYCAVGIARESYSDADLEVWGALKNDIQNMQKNGAKFEDGSLWWARPPDWYMESLRKLEAIVAQPPRTESEHSMWLTIESGLNLLWREAGVPRPSQSNSNMDSMAPFEVIRGDLAESASIKFSFLSTNQSHSENPATTDKLNRQKLVDALAINLTHSTNKHHRAIGLLGEWGSGKSTVLKLLKEKLQKSHTGQPFVFGEFNAWAYEHTDNIQAGVAQEMINALTSLPDKPRTGIRSHWSSIGWLFQRAWLTLQFSVKTHPFEILKILALLLVAAMPWFTDWFNGLINDKDLAIVGQWVWSGGLVLYTLREFGKLIISPQAKELLTYLRLPSYAEHLGKIPVMRKHISTLCELRLKAKNGKTPRLLFVVDDLDRCSPEAIVKVLEAVRLVLDLENVIVLIAIDQHIALAALSKHFNDFALHHKLKNSHAIAREYLSKVINLPIVLTAPSGDDVNIFMVDLWKDMPKASSVGAGDSDQKVPVDNSPAPSSSEMNLPVVDSTLEPDSVPVTDVSPDSDHTEGVKSKATEDDKQVTAKVNPINALSPEQQASFIYWANYFELTNPRQLKRLNNSYDLMRSYLPQWDKEVVEFALTEVDVLKVYPMLLTLILMEYLNSLHSLTERSQLWEKLFSEPVIAGFESAKVGIPRVKVTEINNKRVTSDFVKAYRSLLAAEGNKSLVSNVEAFVLPAMN